MYSYFKVMHLYVSAMSARNGHMTSGGSGGVSLPFVGKGVARRFSHFARKVFLPSMSPIFLPIATDPSSLMVRHAAFLLVG